MEQTLAAAHNGVEAILLDTSLDGMNGWEILPLLRRLDPEARTPVVLLSVETPQSASRSAVGPAAGVAGWVAQPLNEDALLGELARVLCGPGEKARILIVEDDRDLAASSARSSPAKASRSSWRTRSSRRSTPASDFQPHLLVLDIGLPDGDGFNVVDWLRQHESLAHCRWWSTPAAISRPPSAASSPSGPPTFSPRPASSPSSLRRWS